MKKFRMYSHMTLATDTQIFSDYKDNFSSEKIRVNLCICGDKIFFIRHSNIRTYS